MVCDPRSTGLVRIGDETADAVGGRRGVPPPGGVAWTSPTGTIYPTVPVPLTATPSPLSHPPSLKGQGGSGGRTEGSCSSHERTRCPPLPPFHQTNNSLSSHKHAIPGDGPGSLLSVKGRAESDSDEVGERLGRQEPEGLSMPVLAFKPCPSRARRSHD